MTNNGLHEFPGLSPMAFQHPQDIAATQNLQKVPLLPKLLKIISGNLFEKQMRVFNISNRVRLGPNQGGSVYEKFVQAAKILDIPELPEVYISSQYVMNATAFGLDKYQITLYAGLIDFLTEEELLAVIGHELGHIKCEHMLYKSIAHILRILGTQMIYNLLPGVGMFAAASLLLAILQWERMAEFSCDRAALLVVQDEQVVASTLSKLAGGSRRILPEINLEAILEQAQEYEDTDEDLIGMLFKVNMMIQQTHPFPIVRTKEILNWAESEQYQNIIQGDYEREATSGKRSSAATGPVIRRRGRTYCARCETLVFDGWSTCPGCGADLKAKQKDS